MEPSSVRLTSRRGCAVLLLFVGLLGSAGCSLFLSGPNPQRPLHARPECSTSKGAVAVDGVTGGLLIAGGLSQLDNNSDAAAAVPIAFGVLYGVAALYGNSKVDNCNEEIARFDRTEQPQLADGPPGAADKQRWSRDEMVKAIAAKKSIEAQEAAAQLGPPPVPRQPQATAAPRTAVPPPATDRPDTNGNAEAAPPAKPPPKPSPPPSPPPRRANDRWDDFWKEQP